MNALVLEPTRLNEVLRQTALLHSTRESYVGPDARRTWQETLERSTRVAKALLALGVNRGDHVGILLGNCSQWIEIFFGCALIGAVTVPINTRFKKNELEYCLKQSDVKVLFFVERFLNIDFEGMLKELEPALLDALPGHVLPKLLHCISTSGSSDLESVIGFDGFMALGDSLAHRCQKLPCDAPRCALDSIHLWHDFLSQGCDAHSQQHAFECKGGCEQNGGQQRGPVFQHPPLFSCGWQHLVDFGEFEHGVLFVDVA